MITAILLALITLLYTGYNLFIKASGNSVGSTHVAPILATIALQIAALSVSIVFLASLIQQKQALQLPTQTYILAICGGLCIGLAEILYFYLFRGISGERSVTASVAIPLIVGGTIILTVFGARWFYAETLNQGQWIALFVSSLGLSLLAWFSR
ncbi:MAG: hypothetical protein AAF402_03760 [Pseudomonadota bacterium]